jgi:hypothetical protein
MIKRFAILLLLMPRLAMAQTEAHFNLSWDLVEGAVKYRIQTTVGSLPWATALECEAPPCKITGIEETLTYKVRVAGIDSEGVEGEYADLPTFRFADVQPLSPTSLTSTAITSEPLRKGIRLSWPAVTKFRTGGLLANQNIFFPPLAAPVVEYRVYQVGTGPWANFTTTQSTSIELQLPRSKSFHFYVTCFFYGIESYSSPSVRVNTN